MPAFDVASAGFDLARDEREEALGVGVSVHQRHARAEVCFELWQPLDHAVVRKQPALLLEGMGVAQRERAGGGETDVCDEGARRDLLRLVREGAVLVGRDRLLAHVRTTVLVDPAEPRAVGLAMALEGEAVGGAEQPERGSCGPRAGAHAEEPAHDQRRPRDAITAAVLRGLAAHAVEAHRLADALQPPRTGERPREVSVAQRLTDRVVREHAPGPRDVRDATGEVDGLPVPVRRAAERLPVRDARAHLRQAFVALRGFHRRERRVDQRREVGLTASRRRRAS